jgi:hypothetical protein
LRDAPCPASDPEAIAWLVAEVPALRPLSDEHLNTFDELLPYVVFESNFTRCGIPPILRSPEHLRRKRCWKDGLECRNRSRRIRSSSGVRRSS